MKRSDYRGFTVNVFQYSVEFVWCRYKLVTVAICKDKNRKTVRRFTL